MFIRNYARDGQAVKMKSIKAKTEKQRSGVLRRGKPPSRPPENRTIHWVNNRKVSDQTPSGVDGSQVTLKISHPDKTQLNQKAGITMWFFLFLLASGVIGKILHSIKLVVLFFIGFFLVRALLGV